MKVFKRIALWLKRPLGRLISWFSGDFILRRGLNRHIGFYFYVFGIFCVIIAWSLYVEDRLVAVERNKRTIESLEIAYHQKNIELVGLDERSRVEQMLEKYRSAVRPPSEPARTITVEK